MMKVSFTNFLFFACMLATFCFASFTDTHNDGGLNNWSTFGDRRWHESNGVLVAKGGNSTGFVLCDYQNSSDGIFTADLVLKSWDGDNGGVVFRWNGDNQFYALSFEPGSRTLFLSKNTLAINRRKVIATGLPTDTIAQLSVKMVSDTLQFFINEQLVATEMDSLHSSGKFGYFQNNLWVSGIEVVATQWKNIDNPNDTGAVRITKDISSIEVSKHENVRFSVETAGAKPITYQWYSDSGIITEATNPTLELLNIPKTYDTRSFYCKISNADTAIVTSIATLFVREPTSARMTITGTLSDYNNTIVGSQKKNIIVRLYDTPQSDSLLYEELFFIDKNRGVEVDSGRFVVVLGTGITKNDLENIVQHNKDLYVEFSVGDSRASMERLTPRLPLTTVPYALAATPQVLRGEIDPNSVKLQAPLGTHFVNSSDNKTYIKTYNGWIILKN